MIFNRTTSFKALCLYLALFVVCVSCLFVVRVQFFFQFFILALFFLVWLIIYELFSNDLSLKDSFVIIFNSLKTEKINLSIFEIKNIEVTKRDPCFLLSTTSRKFRINYTINNYNILKNLINSSEDRTNISFEEFERKVNNSFFSPKKDGNVYF